MEARLQRKRSAMPSPLKSATSTSKRSRPVAADALPALRGRHDDVDAAVPVDVGDLHEPAQLGGGRFRGGIS
jgi:hypothetical protein